MKKSTMIVIGAVVLLAVVSTGVYFKRLGIKQHEIALANRYEAQFNVVETSLFQMRSTIKNLYKCTDEWADKYIAVVAAQSEGRSGGGMFKSNRESEALGLSPEMHAKLANAIEGQLAEFTRQQNTLTDVWRAHKTYCEDPTINEFWRVPLLAKAKEKPEMITSAATKDAVESKQMSEDLF